MKKQIVKWKKMKQLKFKKEDTYIPTLEEMAENKRQIEICEYYGIRMGCFSEKVNGGLTKDEIKALRFIMANKNIPKNIANRLLATKKERVSIINNSVVCNITEDEAFEMFDMLDTHQ